MIESKDFKIGLIYKYTSPSGKVYIGQTVNEKSRKSFHKTKKLKTYFSNAIQKYGYENMEYEVVIKFKPCWNIKKLKRVLNALEQRYIKLYKSYDRNFGYNLNAGGSGNIGYKHSKEMIAYLKTCPKTEEQLKNLEKGKGPHSEETKKKLRASAKRKKKVIKYDKDMNKIGEYNSISEAADSIESKAKHKTISSRIGECCNEKRPSAYTFIWKFLK